MGLFAFLSDSQPSLTCGRKVPCISTAISFLPRHRENFEKNEGQLEKSMQGPYQAYQGLNIGSPVAPLWVWALLDLPFVSNNKDVHGSVNISLLMLHCRLDT